MPSKSKAKREAERTSTPQAKEEARFARYLEEHASDLVMHERAAKAGAQADALDQYPQYKHPDIDSFEKTKKRLYRSLAGRD